MESRATPPRVLAFDVHSAVGRLAGMTGGRVVAGICGTRLGPEECAPPASNSGLQRNASRALAGRRTPTGITSNDPDPGFPS